MRRCSMFQQKLLFWELSKFMKAQSLFNDGPIKMACCKNKNVELGRNPLTSAKSKTKNKRRMNKNLCYPLFA